MAKDDYPTEFLQRLEQVTNRRARFVIDHILQHGHVTTEELTTLYGYQHAPRAAKDVKDEGIPLISFRVKSSDGRRIAAYKFGDPTQLRAGRGGGRTNFPKWFKQALFAQSEGRCAVCNGEFEGRELQIDHRVPYEIAGDALFSKADTSEYMLLCGSCNRTKSWSCEHCPNWQSADELICRTCYWASPLDYQHIATRNVRRTDILWQDEELGTYEQLSAVAKATNRSIPQQLKAIVKQFLSRANQLMSGFLSSWL